MRNERIFFLMVLAFAIILIGCSNQNDFPVLTGPYLGQDPPGLTPEIFAPGILSAGYSEIKAVFSPDGKEIHSQIWGEPFPASQRPLSGQGEPSKDWRVWITEKNDEGWGELKVLKPSIFGYPAVAENGNLYLATGDIWVSEYVNGDYTEMKKLGASINTEEFYEEDLYIAPDESYLLFCRRDVGYGSWDIFVSFRREDGTWTRAKNMGDKINSSVSEVYPFVTPDGKYMFFSSRRTIHKPFSPIPINYEQKIEILNGPGNGNADIYWVDAGIIEKYKPDELR